MNYSLGYAVATTAWPKSMIGSPLQVISLCEIVRGHDTARGSGCCRAGDSAGEEGVWVVQNEEAVIPRCLFVWSTKSGSRGVQANGFGGQACKLKVPDRALASAKRARRSRPSPPR